MVFCALIVHHNIDSDFASNLKAIPSFRVLKICVQVFCLPLGAHFPLGVLSDDC